MQNTEIKFVDFLRGVHKPKLSWIMAQLVILGVTHRINGVSVNGPILQVQEGQLEKAWQVLNTPVGVMNTGGSLTDENIKVVDLIDSHPLFESETDIEDLPLAPIAESTDDLFDDIAFDVEPIPVPAIIATEVIDTRDPRDIPFTEDVIAEAAAVAELVPDEDPDWNIDEFVSKGLSSMELLGTIEPAIIEVPAVVVEDEDPFAEDNSDDGLWDTDEPIVEENPELDYLKADTVLVPTETQFAGVDGGTKMYEVNSVNLTAIGARVNQKDQTKCTFYAQFKGGTQPYRYGPVSMVVFHDLLGEAVRKAQGRQDVSVGSMYHNLIKFDSEAGTIKCQRLVEGHWVEVLPKSKRVKALKEKHKG